MWIDDTGGADTADAGHEGEMEISVDGHNYTAEENYDLNHDGVADTVKMENSDGTITAYVDTDGDGHADEYVHTDEQGNVVEMARFDASTGSWVDDHEQSGGGSHTPDSQAGHQGDIMVDTPQGTVDAGHATIDSNHDGTPDTVQVTDEQGNTILFTDTNGDGNADVETVVTPDGEHQTYEHTGPGQWTETDGGHGVAAEVPADSDQLWGGGHDTVVEGVAKIDSVTGQWISQN
ncbi:hypothetical protein ORV05_33255 [Amycolatopsis cynarae]|uniref:DUF6802 domain-containing protein n=1 Tax=Amycolatopsis cynarae TaxID=2995223 RepID=A0ABY7B459_9PSEU|nr:DUF6802 family protein [Amycolatopsis sp. HUAS 11-8]WAL65686.1 hypothetical protein ORV05_33255 [Amycolatopsis sp. HUAS 11-8]